MAGNEPDFFSDPEVLQDPKSYFDRMRAQCPVLREPYRNSIMVTGYDAVIEVMNRRDDVFSAALNILGPVQGLPFAPEGGDIRAQLDAHRHEMAWSDHLTCHDGEKHARNRQLMTDLLTYKRLKANEVFLYALADRLLDDLLPRGHCNAATEYAHAAATFAISDLMGIPQEDRWPLVELLGAPPSQVEGEATHRVTTDPLVFLKERFDGYLKDRLAEPRADLMTELLGTTYRDGSAASFEQYSLLARFLFAAGQDTTSRLIAIAIRILAEDQNLQQQLRQSPHRIPDFIEEVLRYESPVKCSYRLAVEDTTIGGMEVPAGTVITVGLMAASNDPAHFPNPDQIDIDRANKRDHLGFSKGAHGCLGAPLARMESRVALERLLARTSNFRISEAHHGPAGARRFQYEPTYTFRSLIDLHIAYDGA
ncbi:MAG: cytochrome P450 [Sphingomonadales bacterium]|nr:cytochrome P450 [Sphingomonadales bacterium]